MRLAFTLVAAALALSACGQNSAQQAASDANQQVQAALDSAFPDLFQTAYRAEGLIRRPGSEETMPIVMIRSGRKMRMELNGPNGASTIINNLEAGEAFVITNAGGRQMAMRMGLDGETQQDVLQAWTAGRTPTRVGPCAGAGQVGTEWSLPATETDTKVRTSCVTTDGILLKATEDGAVTWETTSVTRGPQDPALFTLPAGVQVMDLGAMGPGMRAAIEKMKARQGQ